MITVSWTKSLFNFKYPTCCNNSDTINEFGIVLKKFSLSVDKEKQLKHALAINQMIGNVYTEEDVELSLNEYLKLLNQRRETLKQSQGHHGSLSVVPGMSMTMITWGSKRQYLYGSIVSEIFGDKDIKIVPFMCGTESNRWHMWFWKQCFIQWITRFGADYT